MGLAPSVIAVVMREDDIRHVGQVGAEPEASLSSVSFRAPAPVGHDSQRPGLEPEPTQVGSGNQRAPRIRSLVEPALCS